MTEVVSIIIPIYNVKEYLVKCVNSVISQTYVDLQIILVDDGSTDGSALICDKLACGDSRIEVIHKMNGGLSSARNEGMKAATGEYIYFLDADDYIESDLIEICVNTIHQQGCDVVAFSYVVESQKGVQISKISFPPKVYNLNSNKKKLLFLAGVQIEYDNCGWNAWNRFYSAKLLIDNQIYFPDNKEIFAEDLAHALKVCLYINKICIIPNTLYHYIARQDSIMGKLQENPIEKFVRLCLDFENFAIKRGFKKEFVIVKNFIFSKILYFEMRKSCPDYKEMAAFINKMGSNEKRKIQEWFQGIKIWQIFVSKNRKRILFMFCEISLINCIFQRKRIQTIPEYWIYLLILFSLKARGLLGTWKGKMQKSIWPLYKWLMLLVTRQSGSDSRRAFLLGTEDFGNLGDHEIAVSEVAFLKQYFNKVIEVPASRYFKKQSQKMLIREISPMDVIFLTGGGNFGNVYPMARDIRNDVVRKWRGNKKIIMPQTAYYTHDKAGERALRQDIRLLTEKNHTVIVAREQYSYWFLKKYFQCNILLTPDIVLRSAYSETIEERENLGLLCLRSDKESILDEKMKQDFAALMQTAFLKVEWIDTQKTYNITIENRDAELREVFAKILSASLVVTDRLHGMIFCAITGTPCLVLENYNYKIRGSYLWLETLPYIRLIRSLEDARRAIKTRFWEKQYTYDASPFALKYRQILEEQI